MLAWLVIFPCLVYSAATTRQFEVMVPLTMLREVPPSLLDLFSLFSGDTRSLLLFHAYQKLWGSTSIRFCALESADWCSFHQIRSPDALMSQDIESHAVLMFSLPCTQITTCTDVDGANSSSLLCLWRFVCGFAGL